MNISELFKNLGNATSEQLEAVENIFNGKKEEDRSYSQALLTQEEVMKILNISRTTCWRMIKKGIINPIEIMPGLKRIRLKDIQNIIYKK